MSDTVIRVENVSKLYRLGEVGTGSLRTQNLRKSAKSAEKSLKNSAPKAPSDWVYALKDVSFEVKRGELRTLGRSEKEISKKCLGATKVPDSWRRRHQLLGIIGRNGAGNQAVGQPLGPRQPGGCTGDCRKAARRARQVGTSESTLPQAARRGRRRGKARINSTLLKILSRVTTQSEWRIKVRGRIASLLEQPQAGPQGFAT